MSDVDARKQPKARNGHRLARIGAAALALAELGTPLTGWAATTPAGTVIQASAEVSFTVGTNTLSVYSNAPSLVVDQLIDVAVGAVMPVVPVHAAETARSVAFRITNTGNAPETIRLALTTAVAGNGYDAIPRSPALYLDTDGSGTLTAADVAYAPGSNDPQLPGGASLLVLALIDVPGGLADGAHAKLQIAAVVAQGSGAPGSVSAGSGVAGVDVITGLSGGTAQALSELLVSGVDVALQKTATVLDPNGGNAPQTGARIQYDIQVRVTGPAGVHGLIVSDPIPASTHYVPASLLLDGIALSDAADGDAGSFSSAPDQIQVALGDVPAGAIHHVRFSVLIN